MSKMEDIVGALNEFQENETKETRNILLKSLYTTTNQEKSKNQIMFNSIFDMLGVPLEKETNSFEDRYIFKYYSFDGLVLSAPQREIVNFFLYEGGKRALINAPTSFGKTFLAFSIIKMMKFKKIAFIVPTIFLMNEVVSKLIKHRDSEEIDDYEISVFPSEKDSDFKFINVLTPERFLESDAKYDFVVYDEFYKVSDNYSDLDKENRRGYAFRRAFQKLRKSDSRFILLTPWLKLNSKHSWYENLENKYNTKVFDYVSGVPKSIAINTLNYFSGDLKEAITMHSSGTTLIFAKSFYNMKKYCDLLDDFCDELDESEYTDILSLFRTSSSFHSNKFAKLLKKGILLISSNLPKFLLIEIRNFMDSKPNSIRYIISTSSIAEGVNLNIETIIIDDLDKNTSRFSIMNLAGRAGRYKNTSSLQEGHIWLNEKYRDIFEKQVDFVIDDLQKEGNTGETTDDEFKEKDKIRAEAIMDNDLKKWGFIKNNRIRKEYSNSKKVTIHKLIKRFERLTISEKRRLTSSYQQTKGINISRGNSKIIIENLNIWDSINKKMKFFVTKKNKPEKISDKWSYIIDNGIYNHQMRKLALIENLEPLNKIRYHFAPRAAIVEKILQHNAKIKGNNFISFCSTFSNNKKQLLANEYNLSKPAIKIFAEDKKKDMKKNKKALKNSFEVKYVEIIEGGKG